MSRMSQRRPEEKKHGTKRVLGGDSANRKGPKAETESMAYKATHRKKMGIKRKENVTKSKISKE